MLMRLLTKEVMRIPQTKSTNINSRYIGYFNSIINPNMYVICSRDYTTYYQRSVGRFYMKYTVHTHNYSDLYR